MQGKLSRRINLITVVLTAILAVAAFAVLSVTRSKMLSDDASAKKVAGEYSDLRRAYSQTADSAPTSEITPATQISLSDDR